MEVLKSKFTGFSNRVKMWGLTGYNFERLSLVQKKGKDGGPICGIPNRLGIYLF
jgi:hypothetical protein